MSTRAGPPGWGRGGGGTEAPREKRARPPAAGLASVCGVHVGTLLHVAAAALGLSALLVSSATAYDTVRWLGAAYLVWLGVRRLLARDEDVPEAAAGPDARRPACRHHTA